jgi:hypothetical protein
MTVYYCRYPVFSPRLLVDCSRFILSCFISDSYIASVCVLPVFTGPVKTGKTPGDPAGICSLCSVTARMFLVRGCSLDTAPVGGVGVRPPCNCKQTLDTVDACDSPAGYLSQPCNVNARSVVYTIIQTKLTSCESIRAHTSSWARKPLSKSQRTENTMAA